MTAIRCLSKYALGTQLYVLLIWRNLRRKSEKHEKLDIYAFDFCLLPTIVLNCTRLSLSHIELSQSRFKWLNASPWRGGNQGVKIKLS